MADMETAKRELSAAEFFLRNALNGPVGDAMPEWETMHQFFESHKIAAKDQVSAYRHIRYAIEALEQK